MSGIEIKNGRVRCLDCRREITHSCTEQTAESESLKQWVAGRLDAWRQIVRAADPEALSDVPLTPGEQLRREYRRGTIEAFEDLEKWLAKRTEEKADV